MRFCLIWTMELLYSFLRHLCSIARTGILFDFSPFLEWSIQKQTLKTLEISHALKLLHICWRFSCIALYYEESTLKTNRQNLLYIQFGELKGITSNRGEQICHRNALWNVGMHFEFMGHQIIVYIMDCIVYIAILLVDIFKQNQFK